MAVPVRLRNVPEYLRPAQFTDYYGASTHTQVTESQELLQFPKSTCVLWDGTSTGSPVFLHIAQNRKPRLLLWEKLLWLIHKQVDSEGAANKVLVGSLSVDQDADGVSFKIDRLDTRQTDSNASLLQDDVLIPVQISTNGAQEKNGGSKEDYTEAIKMLQKRCGSHESLELTSLLLVKGWCSVRCHQQAEKALAHLQFDLVTLGNVFKATPVNPVPLIPSALAKNLAGPRSLSQMQGRPKMGYLSMDATRKLLLVLESDPKVSSLPVVGIWVSGVSMVHHPFVWGSCVRYLHNERLQDRVCTPPEGFLLMLYSSMHSKPEFYEISSTTGKPDLQFDLYTGYEVTTLFKKSSGPEPGVLEWDLTPVRNGPKRELFDAAIESVKSQRQEADSGKAKPAVSANEDIMPRMTPAPHQSKAVTIRPMVPELSMIWNDNSSCPYPNLQPFSSASNPPACLNTAFSAPNCAPVSAAVSAPAYRDRNVVGFVPSSQNHRPVSGVVGTGSGAAHCCDPRMGHPQDSDCVPRSGLPAQYPQTQTPCDQNNSARTGMSAVSSSSGCVGVACSGWLPQPAPVPHGYSSSQAGSVNSGAGLPLHGSQAHACAPQQYAAPPQHQTHVHDGFRPQPQNHPGPRLMAPAGIHFCRPNPPGPVVRQGHSFPHPSLSVQRPPHSVPMPQSASHQGQPFRASVPSSCPPSTQFPGYASTVHTNCPSLPQATPGQTNSIPGYPGSVQDTAAPTQGPLHHSQGTSSTSQMQCQPPPRQVDVCTMQQGHRSVEVFPPQTPPGLQPGFSPYAQNPAGRSQGMQPPCSPAQGYVQHDGNVRSMPLGTQSPVPLGQGGNDSQRSDNTSSSAKSSDDSGLSVTPDHSNPSPKPARLPGAQTTLGTAGAPACGLESVNWAGVPGEVVQLLMQQDAQLKMLQAQIQQLLSQQQQQQQQQASAPSPGSDMSTPTPSSALSTPHTLKRETCSTAVNTTLLDPQSPWGRAGPGTQTTSIQTSPQKPLPPDFSPHPNRPSPSSSSHSEDARPPRQQFLPAMGEDGERCSRAHTPSRQGGVSLGETPSELRHQGPVQLSSTEHEEMAGKTGSLHSTGSVEHPSPVRSMESHLHMSNSTPSPLSASMCVRPDEGEEESGTQEVSPDSKEYYDQLISNIRLFLNSHSQDATDNTEANRTDNDTENKTHPGLKMFDTTVGASPSLPACPSGGANNSSSNTTLIPHINYLSMMLGSDTDASLEMNAMAMKYLRDEQLTQVARRHQSPHAHHHHHHHHLLRQALAASLDSTGASDVSRVGLSPNNLSMATRKYLEKHGLLGGGGQGESLLDTNQTIRLQTDFSLAVLSEPRGDLSAPPSPQRAAPQHANTQSPVKREVLKPPFRPSPVIPEERGNVHADGDRRWVGDLGASPVLRPPGRYHRDPSPEDSPVFPERYRGPQQQGLVSDCSAVTDDDRILDIEKLKQMPKLL